MTKAASSHAMTDEVPVDGALSIRNISKFFANTRVLKDVSLDAHPGEVIAICGPSGAGKSTLGRLISGLESTDKGSIHLGDRHFSSLPPARRRVAHMFESLALYPTMNVFDNIASPLRAPSHRGLFSGEQIRARVEEVLALTDMSHLAERRPTELSGGQKQRVALCRTLAQSPSLFILDEPIGHLDAKLRHRLRGEITRRQRSLETTTLWLTPDALEGMAIADRMVMLLDCEVAQIGTPYDIYSKPANTRVARLMGDPAMNLIPLWLMHDDRTLKLLSGGHSIYAVQSILEWLASSGEPRMTLGFPPMHVRPAHSHDLFRFTAEIYASEPFGKYSLVTATLGQTQIKAKLPPSFDATTGGPIELGVNPEHLCLFNQESGELVNSKPPVGSPDTDVVHLTYQ